MADLLERLKSALGERYGIERELGRGGMAVVFLAEDLKHHRQVALKVLHPELTATLGAERFLHEIEIIAGLQHPHILPLYDSGEADGLLYYVMPYARGESLRQRLDREKQLAVDECVRIAVEVADGLDYAHRQGVVHRDIKPGNVLLAEGHATIADFGIARAIEVARADRVTSTGLGVGTPLYASPEQATAQETLDGRTDIYSLGCVLYEMLAGQPPLTGATPQIIQARRVSETPSPLHNLRDTVPPALDHVIARALARIPADRYATASQFGQALQAVLFASTPGIQVDVTPTATTGSRDREAPNRPGSLRRLGEPMRRHPARAVSVIALGLLAIAYLGYAGVTDSWTGRRLAGEVGEIRSLMVLPFHNLSRDEEQETFTDGLTDALIGELGRISTLQVVSSTTSRHYKGAAVPLPDIARERNVDAFVEASVLRAGDQIRITVKLIHGPSDTQLWSEEYVETLSDVLTLQRRVTTEVAERIHVALSPDERSRLTRPAYEPHPEALEAYLRGLHHFNRWGEEDALLAMEYLEQAVGIDPGFALAQAALAEGICSLLPGLRLAPFSEPDCEMAAQRALSLDDALPEAHTALSWVKVARWDWAGAEADLLRAIELNPSAPTAHMWYGWLLTVIMRSDEALAEARRAEQLAPLNLFAKTLVAQPLMNMHRYDEALTQCEDVLRLDPDYGAASIYKAAIHALKGEGAAALESAQQAAKRVGEDRIQVLTLKAWSHAIMGDHEKALEIIGRAEELYGVYAYPWMAVIYTELGRHEEALSLLETSYQSRPMWLPNFTSFPHMDPLRGYPRFQAMRRGMGVE